MPQTQQYDFREEQPSVISYSEYMLGRLHTIYVGQPVEVDTALGTSGVATEAINQNKIWVKRYTTADSTARCVGVATKPMWPVGHANEGRAGMGAYMRDIALLQFGLVPMFNCCDTDVNVGDAVAPVSLGDGSTNSSDQTVVGFKNWEAGETVLGVCHEFKIPAYDNVNDVVHLGLIFVIPTTTASATSVDGLSDTDITAAAQYDMLIQDGAGKWVDQVHSIANVSDVTETSIAAGDLLAWNGSAYVNATFKTIETQSVTSHVHTLAGDTMLSVLSVANRDDGGMLLPSAGAPAAGTYQITDTNTTITTNATDDIAEVLVTYVWNVNE